MSFASRESMDRTRNEGPEIGGTPPARRMVRWLVVVAGLVVLCRFTACGGAEDELASLEFLLCEVDAHCEDGVCTRTGVEVETLPVLARAVESTEASRFAPDGLFVLATWESGDHWVELELDLPTDRMGYVDHDFRYGEYEDGEPVFRAAETRGRIVLVESLDGGLPYAGHIELRMVSSQGEVRRIHLGHLRPDDEDAVSDPGPPDDPIEWDRPGIEVLIIESVPGETYQPRPQDTEGYYLYDYRDGPDPFNVIVAAACEGVAEGCYGTSYYYEDDEGGVHYYSEEDSGSCGSGDESAYGDESGSCSSSDDVYYYDEEEKSGCSGSEDDIWTDDTGDSGSCSSDDDTYYYYEEDKGSSCESDDSYGDSGCDGGGGGDSDPYSDDTSYDSAGDCGGCEGEEKKTTARNERQRRDLRMIARGRPPRTPLQRSLSFSPVVLAFMATRLLRPRRRSRSAG